MSDRGGRRRLLRSPPGTPPATEGQLAGADRGDAVDGTKISKTPRPRLGPAEEPGGPRFYFADRSGYSWGADKEVGEPDHGGDQGGAWVW